MVVKQVLIHCSPLPLLQQSPHGSGWSGPGRGATGRTDPTQPYPPRPLFFRRGLIVSNATRHDATREKVKSSSSGGATKPTSTKIFSPPLLPSPLHPPVTRAHPPPLAAAAAAAAAAGSSIPPGRLPAVSCREVHEGLEDESR
uniref:Uncharacterized protein n=1 Tax=Oryza meridionalis TaxID=40149 RepID=A0A0E0E9V2_9ORYZ